MRLGENLKVNEKYEFVISMDSNKEVVFETSNNTLIDEYMQSVENSLQGEYNDKEGYLFNYRLMYLKFYYDKGFYLEDKKLNETFKYDINKTEDMDNYIAKAKKYVNNFIKSLENETETFFVYGDYLTSPMLLNAIDYKIDLFVPAIQFLFNKLKKENDDVIINYETVFNFLYVCDGITLTMVRDYSKNNKKLTISNLYNIFKESSWS